MTKPIITNDPPPDEFVEYDNEGNAKSTPYTGRPKKPVGTLSADTPVHTANSFVKWHKNPLIRYQRYFYEWRGTKYHEVEDAAIKTALYHFLEQARTAIWVEDKKGEATTLAGGKWVKVAFNPNRNEVNKIIDALEHLHGIFISNETQAPAWLRNAGNKPDPTKVIALQNCILDLETRVPHELTPDFFTMTALPFAYASEAKCPRWEQFIEELFPNPIDAEGKGTRREFQKAIGYLVSSDRSQQKIFLMKGPKRTGKGTTMRVLTALLGRENTTSPELKSLGENFGKADLIGKKAAIFADERLGRDTSSIVQWLLKISGEDDVTIPRKYKGDWTGRLPVRIWMGTNVTPAFDDPSGVIANRFILFLLTRSFFGLEEKDLDAKLIQELPGILNWALAGLAMLKEDGEFIQPEESKETIERMAGIAAPVLLYAQEQLIIAEGRSVARDTLHKNYEDWCEKAGNNSQSRAKFFDTRRLWG